MRDGHPYMYNLTEVIHIMSCSYLTTQYILSIYDMVTYGTHPHMVSLVTVFVGTKHFNLWVQTIARYH